ncbi:MAG: AAA family ATPase [Rhodospirillales bacterium]|nr:AAA family ATPase [Rhodospirillales bacterium]
MKKFDRFLTRRYLMTALRRALGDKQLASKLLGWIGTREDKLETMDAGFLFLRFRELGLDEAGDGEPDFVFGLRRRRPSQRRRPGGHSAPPGTRAGEINEFLSWAIKGLGRSVAEPPSDGAEARATALAARRFRLDGACGPLLELARLYDDHRSPAQDLWDTVKDASGDPLEASAVLLGTSRTRVERALRRLTEVGIADAGNWSRTGAEPDDYVEDWFNCVYRPPVADEQELRERLVPLAPEPLLEIEAFDHLDAREDAVRLLTAAIRSGESVRLLFFGRAGTGKTEAAKTLVRSAGGRLYDLCEPESSGVWGEERTDRRRDPSADKRNRLRMALALLKSEPEAVVLCDEVEDVLSSSDGSRRENHGLLEGAAVPIVFTGNDLSRFDEAMLRRFELAIHFKTHSPNRRRSVVRQMLENSGIESVVGKAMQSLVLRLADEVECPPGIIERAIRSTRLIQGSPDDLFRFAERLERTVSTHIPRPRLGAPVKAELPWEAFGHLGEGADDCRRLFTATLRARREGRAEVRGINFLAYGPPGCGKTAFAHTVAAEAGATLYSVGNQELGPEARLPVSRRASLEYAIEALTDEPNAAILFDELEDFVFALDSPPKHWMNRLAEESPVPILFTANSIRELRKYLPYLLDRMTYSLEFRDLPRGSRVSMFRGLLRANGSVEMASVAEELAADRRVAPRQVRYAGLVADLSRGGPDAVRRAVREKAQLLRGTGTAEPRLAEKYDFSLVHADPDLAAMTDRIVKSGRGRMGILLDGPSGSGKSEYAKQLAKRMDLDPLTKRASELMSSYVGETEQKIAGAFAEARATNSFLIIDEADSFLADRRDAHRAHEVSFVNEMLSQLESHDLPYAFTTDLSDRLDPAVARRFLFRASFKFLDKSRVVRAWEFFFSGKCPERGRMLTRLVPADFALAHERAKKLGYLDDPEQIASELVTQSRGRNRAGSVGF